MARGSIQSIPPPLPFPDTIQRMDGERTARLYGPRLDGSHIHYKSHPWFQTTLSPNPPSSPGPTPSTHSSTYKTMSGTSRTLVRDSDRKHGAAMPTDKLKSRRHARDLPSPPPALIPEKESPPSPNDDESMQRIPTSSTGLWGDDVISVYTCSSGVLTTSESIADYLHFSAGHSHKKGALTEAQQIVGQYRQLDHASPDVLQDNTVTTPNTPKLDQGSDLSKSQHPFPSMITTVQLSICVDDKTTDTAIRAPSRRQRSPMRQSLTQGMEAAHQAVARLSWARRNKTISCTQVIICLDSLNACELCGKLFTDCDSQDDRPNNKKPPIL